MKSLHDRSPEQIRAALQRGLDNIFELQRSFSMR